MPKRVYKREKNCDKNTQTHMASSIVLRLRVVSNIPGSGVNSTLSHARVAHSHTHTHAKWKSVVQSIHSCNRIEIDYTVSARVASIYRFPIEMAFKLTAKMNEKKKQIPNRW